MEYIQSRTLRIFRIIRVLTVPSSTEIANRVTMFAHTRRGKRDNTITSERQSCYRIIESPIKASRCSFVAVAYNRDNKMPGRNRALIFLLPFLCILYRIIILIIIIEYVQSRTLRILRPSSLFTIP